MLPSRTADVLQVRKRLLLFESELNRVTLREDVNRIYDHTRWLRDAASLAGGGSSWLAAAPVAGLLAGRSLTHGSSWVSRGLKLLKLVAVLYPLWKSFAARRKAAAEEAEHG